MPNKQAARKIPDPCEQPSEWFVVAYEECLHDMPPIRDQGAKDGKPWHESISDSTAASVYVSFMMLEAQGLLPKYGAGKAFLGAMRILTHQRREHDIDIDQKGATIDQSGS